MAMLLFTRSRYELFNYMEEFHWSMKGVMFIFYKVHYGNWWSKWVDTILVFSCFNNGIAFFIIILKLTNNNLILIGVFCVSVEIFFIMNTGYHFFAGIPTHFQLTFLRALIYM